jgi:hypothetical protein
MPRSSITGQAFKVKKDIIAIFKSQQQISAAKTPWKIPEFLRHYSRKDCSHDLDYMVQDLRYRGFIGNIIFTFRKECRKMGQIKRRRVHWERGPSEGITKYRVYWAAGRPVDYDSDHVEVENVTQVVLPDDIPSFPLIAGEIELGVSAVSYAGNESEITRATVYFDFTIPEAPKNLMVEDL